MKAAFPHRTLVSALASLILLLWGNSSHMEAAEPTRVLLLQSFGREFEPFRTFSERFRNELSRESTEPIDFFDVALQTARFEGDAPEGPLLDYLLALFDGRPPDLLVPIGGPAARFAQRRRERLFPTTPMLIAAVDQRHVQALALTPQDSLVAVRHEPAALLSNILQVLPATTNIVIVFGDSPLERFWVAEFRQETAAFTHRTAFTWVNTLPWNQIRDVAASLGPRSAIFYGQMSVDAQGVPYLEGNALAELRAVSRAPIFGVHDYQLGQGIVGGPLAPVEELGRQTAAAAWRILRGEPPSKIRPAPLGPGVSAFDWRELRQWGIPESSLPPGSEVRFREPSFWRRYWAALTLVAAAFVGQALIISRLLVNQAKRRRAERAANELGGRLIRAQEEERARLARELHDDITQRLARLAIDAGRVERSPRAPDVETTLREMRDGLVRLSEDVHSLAYRLHPALLEDLGLADALKSECDRFARQQALAVDLKLGELPANLSQEVGLCIFRVMQEALNNVARHAQTNAAAVSVRELDGGLQLAVADQGVGFDPQQQRQRPSLGLASMRERVRLLGGELDIESAANHGTTVVAWAPLSGAKPGA